MLPWLLLIVPVAVWRAGLPTWAYYATQSVGWVVQRGAIAALLAHAHARAEGAPISFASALARGVVAWPKLVWRSALPSLAVGFGTWLLVVPGLYGSAKWALLPSVVVCEDGTAAGAAKRSRGRRWRLLSLKLALGIGARVVVYPVAATVLLATRSVASDQRRFALILCTQLMSALFVPLVAAGTYPAWRRISGRA